MYRHLSVELKLAAGCLSTFHFLCRNNGWDFEAPSTEDFCKGLEVSVDTADRAREKILVAAPMIFSRKKPPKSAPGEPKKIRALMEYLWKQGVRWDEDGRIGEIPDSARCRVVKVAEHMKEQGLTYEAFCHSLGLGIRTLHRLRKGYDCAEELGGLARKSRRPHMPPEETPRLLVDSLCREWQRYRDEFGITEFCSWFNDRFKEDIYRLTEQEPRCTTRESISLKTMTKYLRQRGLYSPQGKDTYEGKRGNYDIFGPLFQAAMDTTTVRFAGKLLKWINFFDIGARTTIAERVCQRERAEEVIGVYEEGRQKCPEMVGGVSDRGAVYVSEELRKAVEDDQEATGFLRVHARRARGEDKAHIERYFRMIKGWICRLDQMLKPLWEELDTVLEPLRETTQRELWRIIIAMILRTCVFFSHRSQQMHIEGQSPLERLEQPPKVSREEAREALRQRAERNMPKKDFLQELVGELGFTKPSRKRQLRQLQGVRMDALREARDRLRKIRANPRPKEHRDNFNYFLAMAKGIASDIYEGQCKQRAEEARRKRKMEERCREQEKMRKEKEFEEEFPEEVLLSGFHSFLMVFDSARAQTWDFVFKPIKAMIRGRLEGILDKFGGLFEVEVERVLDRVQTLKASPAAKEALLAFVHKTTSTLLESQSVVQSEAAG